MVTVIWIITGCKCSDNDKNNYEFELIIKVM